MIDLKAFKTGIVQLAEEKGILEDKVIEILETAMAAAYKKDYGQRGQKIAAKLDFGRNELKFWQVKKVVDETMILSEEEEKALLESGKLDNSPGREEDEEIGEGEERKIRFNEERHILLKEAKKIDPKINLGEDLFLTLEPKADFGRIAAQTAKQVILQKLKELERETVFNDYKSKEGEIISGTVQRAGNREIFFDIGKILGVLPREEQIPGEFYRIGQRFRLYLMSVEQSSKGPVVILSRAFPKFISKLFELEVPEIAAGQMEIKAIAREAGSRTKVSVASNASDVDPIGSAIGQRGTRVSAVINELGGEKVDIIKYSDDPKEYIANSLSPAKVEDVEIKPRNTAICFVPEEQLSLAIGKEGQNVRLAAKLTGWKIDVRSSQSADTTEQERTEEANELPENNKESLKSTSESSDSENGNEDQKIA